MPTPAPFVPADILTPMTDAEMLAYVGLSYADLMDYSAHHDPLQIDTYWTRRIHQRALLWVRNKGLTLINAADGWVQLTGAGKYPAVDGSLITALNASELASGTVPNAAFPAVSPAMDGHALSNLDAAALTGSLPAVDGNAVTNLNAGNITGGPLPALDGNALTNLTAANITPGGTLPALTGTNLTDLNAAALTSGTIPDAALPGGGVNGANQLVELDGAGAYPALDGNAITDLAAGSLVGSFPINQDGGNLTNLPAGQLVGALPGAVADGTYTVGIGPTTNGTITVSGGVITGIAEAT